MQAIEFVSKAHDGVVDLPREHLSWNGNDRSRNTLRFFRATLANGPQ